MVFAAVAAIFSFFFSERILKPKATVLIIVVCILAYDLRTKTHDVTALRVYRGTYGIRRAQSNAKQREDRNLFFPVLFNSSR